MDGLPSIQSKLMKPWDGLAVFRAHLEFPPPPNLLCKVFTAGLPSHWPSGACNQADKKSLDAFSHLNPPPPSLFLPPSLFSRRRQGAHPPEAQRRDHLQDDDGLWDPACALHSWHSLCHLPASCECNAHAAACLVGHESAPLFTFQLSFGPSFLHTHSISGGPQILWLISASAHLSASWVEVTCLLSWQEHRVLVSGSDMSPTYWWPYFRVLTHGMNHLPDAPHKSSLFGGFCFYPLRCHFHRPAFPVENQAIWSRGIRKVAVGGSIPRS